MTTIDRSKASGARKAASRATHLAQLVDMAAPAWSRMIDRGAAVVIGGLQLQQCPGAAPAHRNLEMRCMLICRD